MKNLLINDWTVSGTSLAAIGTSELTGPLVLPWFPWFSQEAAYLLPPLGVVLLLLQIYFKIRETK